jgi:cobalt-zinc-cadmium resistance protein CzcA
MLERLIHSSLQNRLLVLMIIGIIVGFGIHAVLTIPIDAFPDVTNIQVEIISEAPGLSALEIERFVTYPIEMSLRGLPEVVQMRSITKFGLAVITLIFNDDVDIYFARQLVFERLTEAAEQVPPNVKISLGPVATAMGEIYQYTLQGEMPDDPEAQVAYLTELRTIEDWVVSPLLKTVPGVSEVNSFGGYIKHYEVAASPERLLQYDLSIQELFDAIENNNQNVGGNILDHYSEQYIVRGVGLVRTEHDLQDIVLKSHQGRPIFVRDVAEVKLGHAVRQGAVLMNGAQEAVGGIVMMLRGENGREVVTRIKAKVAEMNANNMLPHGIKIVPYYDRSDIVAASVGTVTRALREGVLLVLLILYLFLRSIRGALIVLLALPLSLLLTFTVMKSVGLDANLMSLGGLAISIGMIIDATIIQVENVQRHLSASGRQDRKLTTVLKAVLEVRKPSIFGELIIATTFLPILSLQGMEGKMFAPLALTVAIALLSSLLLSIFVIPAICAMVLKSGAEKESLLLRAVKKVYLPLLKQSLRRKYVPIAIAIVLFGLALLLLGSLGTEFIPIMDEGAFDMDIQLMPGISLNKALAVSQTVEQRLMQFPELEMVIGRTGQTGIALEARGVDKTAYTGVLKPKSQWRNARTNDELIEKMRQSLATIPGMAFSFSQPIQCRIDELVAGTRAQLIIKLFGEDTEVLKRKAEEIANVVSRIRGAADLVVEQIAGQPYLSIVVDRNKIARHGLNVKTVLEVVAIAIGGKAATQLYETTRSFDVMVRFPFEKRNSVATIGNILIATDQGYRVPLSELADISIAEGPLQIIREEGQRRIGIEVNVSDRDIGSFVAEAKTRIKRQVALPAGYYITWGGQFENQQRAMARLMIIAPIAVAVILFLLFLTFNSMRLALLVILNLPFALIGGVLALTLAGLYLSVPASVGFIVLFGVAVLNGVVLVSYIKQLQSAGLSVPEAILMGSENRLRPVLMTASIAIFSLLPLLYASGPGSEVQRPLAVVVVGGLITSTLATLFLLPILYNWFERTK